MREDLQEVVDSADTLVLGNKDPEFAGVRERSRPGQTVIDLARVLDGQLSGGATYQGICW